MSAISKYFQKKRWKYLEMQLFARVKSIPYLCTEDFTG